MRFKIKLEVAIGPEADILIDADFKKLMQITVNLIGNAVKFIPDGGLVRIAAKKTAEDFVEISVSDTGIGIKPEHYGMLFKPFTQLGGSYKKEFEGTGLGLALTKKLVELHKGHIWFESEAGRGSTFTFTVPVKQEAYHT